MARKTISGGTVHELPADIKKMLLASPEVLAEWEDLTPLARNEWICWTTFSQKGRNSSKPHRADAILASGGQAPPVLLARL